jgi:choline dehydrogenase-like flavoprotein
LTILTGALVEKILFSKDTKTNQPVANGVQYSVAGEKAQVKANKEVILSAGSIGSPQILELSGIGDPSLLRSSGIDVVVPNSNVGVNLQDHAYVPTA